MTIYKALFVTTVMIECETEQEAREFFNREFSYVLNETYDGEAIGQTIRSYIVEVPADTIQLELTKLGNDGTFFNDPTKGG